MWVDSFPLVIHHRRQRGWRVRRDGDIAGLQPFHHPHKKKLFSTPKEPRRCQVRRRVRQCAAACDVPGLLSVSRAWISLLWDQRSRRRLGSGRGLTIAVTKAKTNSTAKKATNTFAQLGDGSDEDVVTDLRSIIIIVVALAGTSLILTKILPQVC